MFLLSAGAMAQSKKTTKESPEAMSDQADAIREAMAAGSKEKAKQYFAEKKYAEALRHFQISYNTKADAAQLYNMGRCLQYLDRWPEALEMYERFVKEAPKDIQAKIPDLDGLFREARSHVAQLDLTVSVDGATVLVNDRIVGTTPFKTPLRISTGPARLKIQLETYAPYERNLSLRGEETATIEVGLVSKLKASLLIVKTSTPGSELFIDGKSVGSPPLEIQVESGTRRLRIEHPKFRKRETSAVLVAGEKKELTLDPLDDTPVTARWWFWASIGAGVAAASVTTYMLLTERGPDRGGISPGFSGAPTPALATF